MAQIILPLGSRMDTIYCIVNFRRFLDKIENGALSFSPQNLALKNKKKEL